MRASIDDGFCPGRGQGLVGRGDREDAIGAQLNIIALAVLTRVAIRLIDHVIQGSPPGIPEVLKAVLCLRACGCAIGSFIVFVQHPGEGLPPLLGVCQSALICTHMPIRGGTTNSPNLVPLQICRISFRTAANKPPVESMPTTWRVARQRYIDDLARYGIAFSNRRHVANALSVMMDRVETTQPGMGRVGFRKLAAIEDAVGQVRQVRGGHTSLEVRRHRDRS